MTHLLNRTHLCRRLALIATVPAIALLILVLAFHAMQVGAISGPVSSPTKGGAIVHSGVDLQCGVGTECGPDNPAVGVAASPVIGPKVVP